MAKVGRHIMQKVTVVGSGMTGSLLASLLSKTLPESVNISVLDKSRGAGGRMTTSRGPSECKCSVDLGAQYITPTPDYYTKHKNVYRELEDAGLLRPLVGKIEGDHRHPPDSQSFSTPHGISSLPKHFLQQSGAAVEYNKEVVEVNVDDGRWNIKSADGSSSTSDCLILTMPAPQILNLTGAVKTILEGKGEMLERLRSVSYSSRFALGLFYKAGTTIDVDWCVNYISDHPVIRYVAIDTKKRGISDGGTSVTVHASVPFSIKHLDEDKDSVCTEYLLPGVRQILPQLPQPDAVKNHKWRYSQVHVGYEGSPGAVLVHDSPRLILAGDCFTPHPRFDGCVHSAMVASKLVTQVSQL